MSQDESRIDEEALTPATPKRLAVLIDAENASAKSWPRVQELIARTLPGRVVTAHAFFCGSSGGWNSHPEISLVDGGTAYRGRNAADFLLAFHGGQIVARGEADEIAILSGDDGLAVVAASMQGHVEAVYGLIPCGVEASNYGTALARAVDIAFLVAPVQVTIPAQRSPDGSGGSVCLAELSPRERGAVIADILRRDFGPSSGGWLPLSKIGEIISIAGISLKKVGKLTDVLRASGLFESQGKGERQVVRIVAPRGLPPSLLDAARAEAPPLDAQSPCGTDDALSAPPQAAVHEQPTAVLETCP